MNRHSSSRLVPMLMALTRFGRHGSQQAEWPGGIMVSVLSSIRKVLRHG